MKANADDTLRAVINFKKASVDFAAEAELFSDNKAVLETANVRLEQLLAEAKQQLADGLLEHKTVLPVTCTHDALECQCPRYYAVTEDSIRSYFGIGRNHGR